MIFKKNRNTDKVSGVVLHINGVIGFKEIRRDSMAKTESVAVTINLEMVKKVLLREC